jgi:hypothetical protein
MIDGEKLFAKGDHREPAQQRPPENQEVDIITGQKVTDP